MFTRILAGPRYPVRQALLVIEALIIHAQVASGKDNPRAFATPTGTGTWTDTMSLKNGNVGIGVSFLRLAERRH